MATRHRFLRTLSVFVLCVCTGTAATAVRAGNSGCGGDLGCGGDSVCGFESLFCQKSRWISPGDSFHAQSGERLFAPPMIGDSLSVPTAFGDVNRQVMHPNHFSKIADHNSPIPRTRVFASYQRFSNFNAIETAGNAADASKNLHVYKLGADKKKLFDGNASIDFILPMYQTLSPVTSPTGAPITDELGNIAFGYKHVLYESDGLLVSAGIRAEAPTEDDLIDEFGTPVVQDNWYYQPWIGFISQGDNCTFLHCFVSGRYAGGDLESVF